MGKLFVTFCEELKINLWCSTPYRPKANGQFDSLNKISINILNKHLEEAKGKWTKLLGVLWEVWTILKSSTSETHFSLAYGFEAVIPTEVLQLTHKSGANNDDNKENYDMNLILLEENRENEMIRIETQKMII